MSELHRPVNGGQLRAVLTVLAGVVALTFTTLAATPAQAVAGSGGPVVWTASGAVQGKSHDGVDSFLGIPYAAPPVGALRWRPPQPAAHWGGTRIATHYGNRCPALASTNGPRSNTEDCLFINVQRPAGTTASAHLAVYVFIHGGGLVNGSSNQAGGGKIVRETNALVVSMNYRLGVFGFLALPSLAHNRGNGNFGFLDQQAALRWVHRNIAMFGGDPHHVTLDGESAGGWSVCAHLVAAGSRGLFEQAMMHSGSCFSRSLSDTEAASATVAKAAGCSDPATQLACLRAEPASAVLDASTSLGFGALTSGTPVFPVPVQQAVDAGAFARVPIVIGSNRDEGRTFQAGAIGWTKAQYVAWVNATFGANAADVLKHYPWPATSDKFTAAYLSGAITTDAGLITGIGGCTDLQLTQTFARYTKTWAFEFDARHGPGLVPIPGYVWGAGHAAELAYLFPSFNNGTPIAPTFNAGQRQLSREMVQRWGAFTFDGTPNYHGLVAWPSFNSTGRFLSLRPGGHSQTITTTQFRGEHSCNFWNSLTQ